MKSTLKKFYSAFQKRDAATMISCYHKDVKFTDPAFGTLKGTEAKAMWQMLCENGKDLKIDFEVVDDTSVKWHARYTFSRTGRPVTNNILAKFEFENGKIIRHSDHFNLHKWAGHAFGWKGKLIGGTGYFRRKLQQQTDRILKKYMDKNETI